MSISSSLFLRPSRGLRDRNAMARSVLIMLVRHAWRLSSLSIALTLTGTAAGAGGAATVESSTPGSASFPAPVEEPVPTTATNPAPAGNSGPGEPSTAATNPAPAGGSGPGVPAASAPSTVPDASPNTNTPKVKKGGVYLGLTGGPIFGIEATHQWASPDGCPAFTLPAANYTWTTGCSASSPIGFVFDARLGYNLGGIGIEGFALVSGDWSMASLDSIPEGLPLPGGMSDMHVGRIGGGLGGGLRLMTPKNVARLTLGGGGGVMFRHVYTNLSSLDGTATGYVAPMVRADVGIVLLNVFTVGAIGYVEFADTIYVQPDFSTLGLGALGDIIAAQMGSTAVSQGNQYFIGPYVGFLFGG